MSDRTVPIPSPSVPTPATFPPIGRPHPIARVDASDFGGTVEGFYAQVATQPVIVRGVLADNPFVQGLDRPSLEALLGETPLWGFDAGTLTKGEYIPANVLFDDMRAGRARWNVVDHSVLDTPLADRFVPPAFLRHNWFADSGMDTDRFVASVNCSVRGSFSPIHVDPYGMQGWMYLIFGRKRWRLYPRHQIPLLYDMTFKTLYHRTKHASEQFPLLGMADYWEGELGPGELLFFPAGWPHEVITLEESFGLGGALVNDFQVMESTRSWLWEYAMSGPGNIDFPAFLTQMAADRPRHADCQALVQAAVALVNAWKASTPVTRYGGEG